MSDEMEAWGIEGETPQEGEWPKCDAVSFVREVGITRDMRIAGGRIIRDGRPSDAFSPEDDAERIYRAMAALTPVELVSAVGLAAVRERDEALQVAAMIRAERDLLRDEVIILRARSAERDASVAWAIKRGSGP